MNTIEGAENLAWHAKCLPSFQEVHTLMRFPQVQTAWPGVLSGSAAFRWFTVFATSAEETEHGEFSILLLVSSLPVGSVLRASKHAKNSFNSSNVT